MSIGDHNTSEKAEFETCQAANLVKQLNRDGLKGLTAIRILKIAAFSIEVNVSDVERMARYQREVNKQ